MIHPQKKQISRERFQKTPNHNVPIWFYDLVKKNLISPNIVSNREKDENNLQCNIMNTIDAK